MLERAGRKGEGSHLCLAAARLIAYPCCVARHHHRLHHTYTMACNHHSHCCTTRPTPQTPANSSHRCCQHLAAATLTCISCPIQACYNQWQRHTPDSWLREALVHDPSGPVQQAPPSTHHTQSTTLIHPTTHSTTTHPNNRCCLRPCRCVHCSMHVLSWQACYKPRQRHIHPS